MNIENFNMFPKKIIPHLDQVPKNLPHKMTNVYSEIPYLTPISNHLDHLESIQAQLKIIPSHDIGARLKSFIKSGIIAPETYDRIMDGKSAFSQLLKNEPTCQLRYTFEQYLSGPKNKKESLLLLEEAAVLGHYSAGGYFDLNKALREGLPLSPELQVSKELTSSALKKLPDYDGVVYRGSSKFAEAEYLQIGDIYEPKQFLSTSMNNYRGPYSFVIKSKHGKDILGFEAIPDVEREVLFDCSSKFRVLNIEDSKNSSGKDVKTYYLEEI